MAREMKATFILRGLSDQFFYGTGLIESGGLWAMGDMEKFEYLQKHMADLQISMKIGSGQFKDRVELNQILRTNPIVKFSLEPRRGYKLATFIFY